MAGVRSLDIFDMLVPESLATQIARSFQTWEIFRNVWYSQKREIRDYIFATDTTFTSNSILPWKNSTHIPKLCQIRDNLHANYMSALFPTNDRPITWEGDDEDSEAKSKRLAIESYMDNKMRNSGFETEISKCVLDWIDFGNTFGITEFVAQETTDPNTGEKISGYVGPKLERISPYDIVFNPTSPSFEESPKIVRSLLTLGTMKAMIEDHPEKQYLKEAFDRVIVNRHKFTGLSQGDFAKNTEFQVDGFSNYLLYFQSEYVEVLDFYGDIYDMETGEFLKNYIVTVVDRSHIIRKIPNPSWLGRSNIFHCGWRLRPDNIYAMGPLDNLVGMQYRIDHLENAKADAFDLIVHPVIKIKGFVEDFEYAPGERIFTGDDGDVEFMRPDVTMLNADTQIKMYEDKMEEMAGAPKQAMGFRTPGEKTAYEVQVLENGSNRIFVNKAVYFEQEFIEKILNSMLEISRRNMGASDLIRTMDNQFGVVDFLKVSKEDIVASGKLRSIGARHFARNANLIQNITQFANSALGQDPAVNTNISGKKLAYLMEELLGLERFGLVQDNIRVSEQLETAKLQQSAQQLLQEQGGPTNGQGPPTDNSGGKIAPPDSNHLATLNPRTGVSQLPRGANANSVGITPKR